MQTSYNFSRNISSWHKIWEQKIACTWRCLMHIVVVWCWVIMACIHGWNMFEYILKSFSVCVWIITPRIYYTYFFVHDEKLNYFFYSGKGVLIYACMHLFRSYHKIQRCWGWFWNFFSIQEFWGGFMLRGCWLKLIWENNFKENSNLAFKFF